MSDPIPIFIRPDSMNILIIGGGQVALRKCRHFKGSQMAVIADDVLDEMRPLVNNIIKKHVNFDADIDTKGYDLVVAATDDKRLNDSICESVLASGGFVNSAHGGGNVLIPSVLKREGYTVSVSSNGNAPAFPPYLVGELDVLLDERYDNVLKILIELKRISKKNIGSSEERREFYRSVLSDNEIMDMAMSGRTDEAIERAVGGMK